MEVLTRAAGLFGSGVDPARRSLQVRKVQTSEAPLELAGPRLEINRRAEMRMFRYTGLGSCKGTKGPNPSQAWGLWEWVSFLLKLTPRKI